MTRRSALPALFLIAVAVFGCDVLRAPDLPTPCAQRFSPARCLAMADTAAVKLDVTRADIVAMDVLPDGIEGATLSAPPVSVRVTFVDGSTKDLRIGCAGVSSEPACVDDPHLEAWSPIHHGGYHDIPCEGEPPAGCATPVPTPDPAAIADGAELRIDRLDIPIDRVGDYEVPLGEARLPGGLLSVADFAFVDRWPASVTILEGGARLEIRSLEAGGRRFGNIYEHGSYDGAERVEASLVFHVDRFDPGAVLSIRDIVVR